MVVVEDEWEVAEYLERALARIRVKHPRISASVFGDPDEALVHLSRVPLDMPVIVFADYRLRGARIDGLQMLHEVPRVKRNARRILLSGYSDEAFEGKLEQVDLFVQKPVRLHEFERLITRLLPGP